DRTIRRRWVRLTCVRYRSYVSAPCRTRTCNPLIKSLLRGLLGTIQHYRKWFSGKHLRHHSVGLDSAGLAPSMVPLWSLGFCPESLELGSSSSEDLPLLDLAS